MKKFMLTMVFISLTCGLTSTLMAAAEPSPVPVKDGAPVKSSAKPLPSAVPTENKKEDVSKPVPSVPFNPTVFDGTAYEAISANPQLSTFMTALNKAGLAEELKSKGPVTVFAPDNEAFSKLPDGFLDTLMESDDMTALKSILSYHIVPGKILSIDLSKEETPVANLNQRAVRLKKTPEGLLFNNGLLTTLDIQTKNGVVNIVNSIDLNPEAFAAIPMLQPSSAPGETTHMPAMSTPTANKAMGEFPKESKMPLAPEIKTIDPKKAGAVPSGKTTP